MAAVKFYLRQNSKQIVNLQISFSDKTNFRLRCVTAIQINRQDWNEKDNTLKKSTHNTKERKDARQQAQRQMQVLEAKVLDTYLEATATNEVIDTNWLRRVVAGESREQDETFTAWVEKYIEFLPYKHNKQRNRTGASAGTIARYKVLKNNITEYERHKGKKYRIKDIGTKWADEYQQYLYQERKLADHTVGRYLKFVKTICFFAAKNEIEVNKTLSNIEGYAGNTIIQYLTPEEIQKIEQALVPHSGLENARQWLIISCYVGQRVSDLMQLTKDNIVKRGGYTFIDLIQEKTGKEVSVPLRSEVEKILRQNKGQFPRPISSQKYNKHIKKVAELAGITYKVEGTKRNSNTNRKEVGIYRKCDLITSHIGRRSFATNFYGEERTALLIAITGHSTEREFLNYIGKKATDKAMELAKLWQKEERIAMKVTSGVKKLEIK